MNLIKHLLLTLILLCTLANARSFVYITDQVDIPMREDKTFGGNILRSLSSGSKLSILQATEDGWSQVKYENSTGWVISRYLSNNPPARVQLEKLRQRHNANQLLTTKQSKRNTELEKQIKTLKNKNIKLSMQISKSQAEKQHIEQIYKDALKLEYSNEKLTTKVLQLKAEIQLLESNSTATQDSSSRNWFIVGSLVLFFGIMIGFIFPNFVNRRRY
ncbi:SH3, type 3 domain protein [Candidatus Ruthia magnifica str. Cm (Calyptogena magnifica)]|uniref:SH3, type 3 domain protein n=1 Tax=Ruthia magnifica subsp. Calyptogena magnifica TaxID=413404 RepID=A1AWB3_RUTMC|nr:TIGR04211 family SH3 domain-containing protein [Candidatus Ruthturnera calyptogenae]ABL02220.1 SH3, type 3 domain protein [Candidatus Ruthia magnifica str. Cm (Calyptogena magnifica)]